MLIYSFLSSFILIEKKGWSDGSEDHFVAEAKYDFTGEGEEELSFQTGQRIRVAPKGTFMIILSRSWFTVMGCIRHRGWVSDGKAKPLE